jgi:hypothetical protein
MGGEPFSLQWESTTTLQRPVMVTLIDLHKRVGKSRGSNESIYPTKMVDNEMEEV